MKSDIIKAVHKELGHTGIMRTYQAIHDRFFWKGMFADVYKEVTHCTTCQYHAPKAARAAIAGHIVAARPAEMVTMDIVHMPNVNGYKYMLTVVDVFSKYGAAVPLTDITSTAVITALAQDVLVHGYGRPKYWVVDGGSEFQDVMEQAVKSWGALLHRSSANHPQSHGLIEKYNQTVENRIAKMLSDHEEATWIDIRPAAVEAINNSVQGSVSDGKAAIAPAELWFARIPVLQSVPMVLKRMPKGMAQYARLLKRSWEQVQEYVSESGRVYRSNMRKKDADKSHTTRKFGLGDEVIYYKPKKSKRERKLAANHRGPYKIMEVLPSGVTYRIKRVGSHNKKDEFKVHVDDIRRLRRFESATGMAHKPKQAAADSSKTYEIEGIMGERQAQGGQTQYLIKWEGFQQHSWEPLANLTGCPEKVTEWTRLSHTARLARHARAKRIGIVSYVEQAVDKEQAETLAIVANLLRDQSFVCLDIAQSKDVLQEVCDRAGISVSTVAAVLLSPPCETFSVADATNQTRGNHYREHSETGLRPPRALSSCHSANDFAKRETAIKHDVMVQGLVESLTQRKSTGEEFEIVMENPVGSLRKRDYMQTAEWQGLVSEHSVTYCAYGLPYRKATNIWTTMKSWKPKGTTGNGKCGFKCGQLQEQGLHMKESTAVGRTKLRRGRHLEAIGAEPARLPKGPRQKQKIWSIPAMLQKELLDCMPEKTPEARYVIDLFSGGESWRRQVEAAGYTYIGVDLRRNAAH
jgi:hypothetical protein